jgi:hypothetical protein
LNHQSLVPIPDCSGCLQCHLFWEILRLY